MKQRCLVLISFLVCVSLMGGAQTSRIFDKGVKSLRLLVDDRPVGAFPILTLGGEEKLHVSFDKMSHEFVRYTYRIEHLDRDFKPENGLFSADYVDGASTEKVIEDYTTTTNTTVPYTHYEFTLPSSRMRPLLSGNYRLTIETEGEDGEPVPVAETYFYIVEPLVSITSTASTDTEIDRDETHQQLTLAVDFSRLSPRNATEELSLVVLKNNRWSDAVRHPRPTAETGTRLLWEHSRELIFNAGNEFRKFEIPSTRYPGMHVDGVSYHAPLYHATVAQDDLRRNYLYDEDQNGRYVFLAEGGKNPDTEGDYLMTHFSLDGASLPDNLKIYLDGEWTHHALISEYELHYNQESHVYEADILLKQGYYSYQYVCVDANGKIAAVQPIEGNFWQTENEYTLLVYYRAAGARYDRLVGWRTASYRP